jgi:uncharacterized sporulation protein YeaH/YhbH (DUF444 family)
MTIMTEYGQNYGQLKTVDELLERDKIREKDGFPRKIRLGRIIKPGKAGKDKIIVVPTTVEEKFYHDKIRFKPEDSSQHDSDANDESLSGGTGEEEEGEVLGEIPIHNQGEGGAGEGEGNGHKVTANTYDLGKILTERFKLPNLKDKGKKKTFKRMTYEMTDKNRGFGQILDKKASLKRIVQTNRSLDRLKDITDINSENFIIDPHDLVYRVLSREKEYESQALVFFIRDYSASMYGNPTEIVTSQHLMIYSWLTYQYDRQVQSRFILHDDSAREVPDFYTYYNLSIAGGTYVASAYKLVNSIVKKENLARDYNIYVFHGTDGDDSESIGKEALSELKIMLKYTNRIGITIVNNSYRTGISTVQRYLEASKILESHRDLIHLSILSDKSDENSLIDGLKELIEEK